MSPLAELILRAMRAGARAAAVFVLIVIGIEGFTHWRVEGLTRANVGFMVILAAMLAGSLWLSRAIGRELAKPDP